MKLFTVAGVSQHNGRTQFRFANSMSRETVLARNGHTDIQLFELPRAMDKAEATEWLQANKILAAMNATFDVVKIPTVKSIKGRKETVLWKSMSKKMRAIKGMETLQFAGE